MKNLYIQMLGGFSISTEDKKISDRDNRSRKLWILLAYMVYHRHRIISQEELIELLWSEGERSANPAGALKTMVHRLRTMLEILWPSAGQHLIIYQNGGYTWNSEVNLILDIEQFEQLCCKGAVDEKEQIQRDFQALQLYRGDFLANMSSEVWVIPIAAYYHNCYMQSLMRLLPALLEQGRYSEAAELCRMASMVEPFHEEIHCYLMRALFCMGDQKGAVSIYKKMSERLLSNFGITPSDAMRRLYYEIIKTKNDCALSIETIQEQLREEETAEGALICEYDFFRMLYRCVARSIERSGIAVHIALLSVSENGGTELPLRKQQEVMQNLQELIRNSLRRGDTAAQCSISQYILLLPQANYENSCVVCERIIKGYYRKHPHANVVIHYAVYSLKPDEKTLQVGRSYNES